ncbi:MAG TPA: branched-chain amino acid aminotransferase, partial [Alphaproteobacteria bacterium]|nr:branched-chain amino acid aminotransferase [Alphaproteobacteria bacterium]
LHCARAIRSAEMIGLRPSVSADDIARLVWEGIARLPRDAELYIRPLFYAAEGWLAPNPDTTRFALTLEDAPLPEFKGFSATLSPLRRPSPETAPTEAKVSGLYVHVGRISADAGARGFDSAVVLDLNGNVAEFAAANLFIVKNGVAHTPVPNRTFLNGITRQRVVQLLRAARIEVVERTLTFAEVMEADEIFSTGNYAKVMPCTRIETRDLQPGPVTMKARELYLDWAKTQTKPG